MIIAPRSLILGIFRSRSRSCSRHDHKVLNFLHLSVLDKSRTLGYRDILFEYDVVNDHSTDDFHIGHQVQVQGHQMTITINLGTLRYTAIEFKYDVANDHSWDGCYIGHRSIRVKVLLRPSSSLKMLISWCLTT